MNYKKVLPEILLDLGDKTIFDDDKSPVKKILKLHINLENWYGDDLLWNLPETIVTEKLKEDLASNIFTGIKFDNLIISKDEYFEDNYHLDIELPKFYWMKIIGKEGVDDFFIKESELFLSDRVLGYLQENYSVKNLQIEPQKNEFDDFILSLVEKDKRIAQESQPNVVYKQHNGKTYTEEEWRKYEEEMKKNDSSKDNRWQLPPDWNKN